MRRIGYALFTLLALAPPLWADDQDKKPQTPADQVRAILKEYTDARAEFMKEYREAKPEDRAKLLREKNPQPGAYADRLLELAEKNPNDAAAVTALVWVVQQVRMGPAADKALARLTEHAGEKGLIGAAQAVSMSPAPAAEKFLRAVLEKNPDKDTKGFACFALAEKLKREGDRSKEAAKAEDLQKQAESLYERVTKDFADVPRGRAGTLGDAAKGALFELRFLSVGKVAPDIKAEDTTGQSFKLSDYRGKVVLLDFWGHW